MMHYHGTPITPRSVLHELAGRNFCVSFSDPRDVNVCHQIGQSVMLDNGSFTAWTQGRTVDWEAWADWVLPWLDYKTTWAVLPDSIDGDEQVNDHLIHAYSFPYRFFGDAQLVPVWHLHESLDRLCRLVDTHRRVCFGSSGAYRIVGSDAWRRRVTEAFDAISGPDGTIPWVHMLRGMKLAGQEFPFASVDSTDVARNHNRPHKTARKMADEWDAIQCPGKWVTHRQLAMDA